MALRSKLYFQNDTLIFTLEDMSRIATVEETKKRGRPRRRWRDDTEEDLNMIGIKNR